VFKAPSLPGHVWIHVHRLGDPNRLVWTVQIRPRRKDSPNVLRNLSHVSLVGFFESAEKDQSDVQPRLYFWTNDGSVSITGSRAIVFSRMKPPEMSANLTRAK